MRVTSQTRTAHGAALLGAAARLFRGRGIEPVRIADVAAAAGLTHGAFYGHFASKADLTEAACRAAMAESAVRWHERARQARAAGQDPLGAIIDAYLTPGHRDRPEQGCWLGALAGESARAAPGLRAAQAEGASALQGVLAEAIAARHPGWPPASTQRAAGAVLAALLGGLTLARVCADDPERSAAALAAAAALARAAADLATPET